LLLTVYKQACKVAPFILGYSLYFSMHCEVTYITAVGDN